MEDKSLIVTRRTKEFVSNLGYRIGEAALIELDHELKNLIKEAIGRCKERRRVTISPADISE